jgi:hypothetical protein
MPVSASVMVTFRTLRVNDARTVELLILWRGTPGWFTANGSSGSSSSGNSTGGGGWSERYARGSFSFEINGNSSTRTANVLGRTLDLTKENVVLVEGADSAKGPQIVRTLVVDAPLPDGNPNEILKVLGRVQELRDYLRCETPLPDASLQARLAPMCALVLAPQ